MLRITGGKARGIRLENGASENVRPATDYLRQAVFNYLGPQAAQGRFLDLFAGTGAYGLEFISRGARGGVFVEQDHRLVAAIEQNMEAVMRSAGLNEAGGRGICRVVQADALRFRPPGGERFAFVVIDPPYALYPGQIDTFFDIASQTLEDPGGLLLLEMPTGMVIERPGWELLRVLGNKAHKKEQRARQKRMQQKSQKQMVDGESDTGKPSIRDAADAHSSAENEIGTQDHGGNVRIPPGLRLVSGSASPSVAIYRRHDTDA